MPKRNDTEYRSRAGVEDEAEDRNERVDDRVDDRDREKTEFSSDDRDSSFRAANQPVTPRFSYGFPAYCRWLPYQLPFWSSPVLYQFQTLLCCCDRPMNYLYHLFLEVVGWVAHDGLERGGDPDCGGTLVLGGS